MAGTHSPAAAVRAFAPGPQPNMEGVGSHTPSPPLSHGVTPLPLGHLSPPTGLRTTPPACPSLFPGGPLFGVSRPVPHPCPPPFMHEVGRGKDMSSSPLFRRANLCANRGYRRDSASASACCAPTYPLPSVCTHEGIYTPDPSVRSPPCPPLPHCPRHGLGFAAMTMAMARIGVEC